MKDQKRYVVSEGSGEFPPLMFIFHNRLTLEQCHHIRKVLSQAQESRGPFIIDGGVEVYQLIDGRWIHLDGSVEIVDGPKVEPTKVNFREFL